MVTRAPSRHTSYAATVEEVECAHCTSMRELEKGTATTLALDGAFGTRALLLWLVTCVTVEMADWLLWMSMLATPNS